MDAVIEKIKAELAGVDSHDKLLLMQYLIDSIKNDMSSGKPSTRIRDLSGKLQWNGDPVAEQRRLRNEW